jgi:hypothetical protein
MGSGAKLGARWRAVHIDATWHACGCITVDLCARALNDMVLNRAAYTETWTASLSAW